MNTSISWTSKLVAVIFALGLLLPAVATADKGQRRATVKKPRVSKKVSARRAVPTRAAPQKYKKVTRYGFDNDTVEATADQGNGSMITTTRRFNHTSLITVRKNFMAALIRSAEDL